MKEKVNLTASQLQWVAVICMVIDHVAWVFLPAEHPLSLAMHFVGRITFPIMGYFIAQGYHYSKNVPKYIGRLFLLAAISIVPFYLMAASFVGILQNTVFTLAFSLSALYLSGKTEKKILKILITTLFVIISVLSDAGISGVLMIYFMGTVKDKRKAIIGGVVVMEVINLLMTFGLPLLFGQMPSYGITDIIFTLGSFAAIPILLCYCLRKT